ncbi:MAG: hypothetical protein QXL15_00190, partial [Candidatus Korarchaeota archaeon]
LTVTDNAAVDKNSVRIIYRVNYGEWHNVSMIQTNPLSNEYEYTLGYLNAYAVVEMYFTASDINGWKGNHYSAEIPFKIVVAPAESPYGGIIIFTAIGIAAGVVVYYFYRRQRMISEAKKEFWKRKI